MQSLLPCSARSFLALVLVVLCSSTALAQPERFVAGTHYLQLDAPLRTADANTIEVGELFWYGCGHCFAFEPTLQAWQGKQLADVSLRRIPATWDPLLKIHAQMFYTAEAMAVLPQVHDGLFSAIHEQGNRLQNEKLIREKFVELGASGAEFDSAFNSFAVATKVKQAEKLMQDYGVLQTPTLYVNGKYVVTTAGMSSPAQMLEVVDFLVAKERNEIKALATN